jgi:hypothetical protein
MCGVAMLKKINIFYKIHGVLILCAGSLCMARVASISTKKASSVLVV